MTAADDAIRYALNQVGKPYKWGTAGPATFDCSGLVMAAYASAGIKLPRTTYAQVLVGSRVPNASALAPGDLVFPDSGHVQIYLGNGRVVEAPHTGAQVRIVNLYGFWTARRVTAPGTTVVNIANPNNVPNPNVGQGDLKDPKTGKNCYLVTMTGVGPVFIWTGDCPDSMRNDPPATGQLPPGVPNPLNGIDALIAAFQDIGSTLKWITDSHNWVRIGEFAAGLLLLLIGAIGLSKVQNAVKSAGKVAQNAAS